MLILNVANNCVTSSTQRHVPGIKYTTLYVRKTHVQSLHLTPSLRISAYTLYYF